MINSPDLTIKQVEAPLNNRCSSGHVSAHLFRRGGKDSPEEPIRFFEIYKGSEYLGIFCEPCLTVANHISKQLKNK